MITPFDIVLILVGLAALVVGIAVRYVRALILLFGTYLASIFAGYLYPGFAHIFFALGHGTAWFDALSFSLFFIGGLITIYALSRKYFPDTTLPAIGPLDRILGGGVGLLMALFWMTITYATLRLMVSRPWTPEVSFYNLFNLLRITHLGPLMQQLLSYYALLFKPFSWQVGLPAIFTP